MNGSVRRFGEFTKIEERDDGTVIVQGIASTEAIDSDGETIKASAIRRALPDYLKFGAIREMHQPTAAGTALACEVMADGTTYLEAHIVDPVAVLKVKNKVYKGFSIGGRVPPGGRSKLDATIIENLTLTEISLVDRPANPEAVIQLFKADGVTDDPSAKALSDEPAKGDVAGHPFRGNQYSDGSGSDGIDDDVEGMKVGTPEYHAKKATSRLANVINHVDGANANLDLIEEEMDGGEDYGLIRDGLRDAKRRLDFAEDNLSEAKRSMKQHDGVSSAPGKHGLNGDYANREAEYTEARERHGKLKTRFSDDYQGKADQPEITKGDQPGHPFRGNQYGSGEGGTSRDDKTEGGRLGPPSKRSVAGPHRAPGASEDHFAITGRNRDASETFRSREDAQRAADEYDAADLKAHAERRSAMGEKDGRSLMEWENADLSDSELQDKLGVAREGGDDDVAALVEADMLGREDKRRAERDDEEQQDAATYRSYKEKVSTKDIAEMDGSEINRRGRFAQQASNRSAHEKAANFHAAMARYHAGQGNQTIAGANKEAAMAHRAAATKFREHNASDGEKHQGIDIDATSVLAREASMKAQDARDPIGSRQTASGRFKTPKKAPSAQREATARGRAERRQAKGMPLHVPEPKKKADQPEITKGDSPGHPFRGNQYSEGGEGGGFDDDGEPSRAAPPEEKAYNRVRAGKTEGGYHGGDKPQRDGDSRNSAWGFYGGARDIERRDPKKPDEHAEGWEWERSAGADAAFAAARDDVKSVLGVSDEDARDLLDSPFGRHLADQFSGGKTPYQVLTGSAGWRRQAKSAVREIQAQRKIDAQDEADRRSRKAHLDAGPDAIEKGDAPGHPFRGNQHTGGEGSGESSHVRSGKREYDVDDAADAETPEEHDRAADYHIEQAGNHEMAADEDRDGMTKEHRQAMEAHERAARLHQKASRVARKAPDWAGSLDHSDRAGGASDHARNASAGAGVKLGKADKPEMAKGDVAGHPFRGNQHSQGEGGGKGDAPPPRETKGFDKDGQPVVGRQTKAPARKKTVQGTDARAAAETANSKGAHTAAADHHAGEAKRHRLAAANADARGAKQHEHAAAQHTIASEAHRAASGAPMSTNGGRMARANATSESKRAHRETGFTTFNSAKADTDTDITKAAPEAPQEEAMADPKQQAEGLEDSCETCGAAMEGGSCPECAADGAETEGDASAEASTEAAPEASGEAEADASTGTRDDDDSADGTAAEGNRFQARAAKLAKQAAEERATLRKEKDALAKTLRETEEKLAKVSALVAAGESKIAKVSAHAETATDEIRKMRRDLATTGESLEKAQIERDGLRERLAKVQSERDAVSSEASRYRAENDDAEHAVAKLTGDRDSLADRITKVQQERDRMDEELQKVRAARDVAETSFEKVAAEKAIMDGRVAKMLTERDSAVADAARLRVERDSTEDRFDKVASEKDVLGQRLTKATAEVGALSDRLAKAQSGLESAEITITKMTSEIEAANQRAARLTKSVDAAEGKASQVAAALDIERNTLAKVNAEASTIRKALDRARTERDEIAKARDAAAADAAQKAEEISALKKMAQRERDRDASEIAKRDAAVLDLKKSLASTQDALSITKRERAAAEKARDEALADAQRKAADAVNLKKAAVLADDRATAAKREQMTAERERDAANAELQRRGPKGAVRAVPVEKAADAKDARTGEEAEKEEPQDALAAIRKIHKTPSVYTKVGR